MQTLDFVLIHNESIEHKHLFKILYVPMTLMNDSGIEFYLGQFFSEVRLRIQQQLV